MEVLRFQSQYFQLKSGTAVFLFQKIFFKVRVMKTFTISSDCQIKTCRSLKRRAILKSLVPFFRRIYALSVGFKMKPLRQSVFLCEDKNQITFCCITCWKDQRFNFCLFDESTFFQNLYSLICDSGMHRT